MQAFTKCENYYRDLKLLEFDDIHVNKTAQNVIHKFEERADTSKKDKMKDMTNWISKLSLPEKLFLINSPFLHIYLMILHVNITIYQKEKLDLFGLFKENFLWLICLLLYNALWLSKVVTPKFSDGVNFHEWMKKEPKYRSNDKFTYHTEN